MKLLRLLTIFPTLIILFSVIVGCDQYLSAKEEMRQDLNHALSQFAKTLSEEENLRDPLQLLQNDMMLTLNGEAYCFNQQLTMGLLKDTSHITLCLDRKDVETPFRERALISSDTLLLTPNSCDEEQKTIIMKAFANPSFASVLGHSNQRLPATGLLVGFFLLGGLYFRINMMKRQTAVTPLAPTPLTASLHLTPMQEQLMELFASAPDHILTKETICQVLWPKKDHPEDTLYTFISRLKTALRSQSDWDIVNKRGREYQLTRKS